MNTNLIHIIKNYKVKTIDFINNSNSIINKLINKIYVINLYEDILKRNYIIILMKKYNINFTLVIVERVSLSIYNLLCKDSLITISELGCCLSHMWCLFNIISQKSENAIIFEDDIILHKDFTRRFIKIYEKQPKIDFLLLGAHDFNFSNYNYKNVVEKLYKPEVYSRELYGAHANYYSYKGAKRMFYIRATEISFFDKEYMLMFNHFKRSYVCFPNLVVSNITMSTLNHQRDFLSNYEIDYYKKCFIKFNFGSYNFIYLNLLSNTIVDHEHNYEKYIEKSLYYYFYDFNKINEIKKRFVMNFFNMEDIKNIFTIKAL